MDEKKKQEIKDLMLKLWDSFEDKNALAKDIEIGYIFGKYSNNEHFQIDELISLIKEVELELNPPKEEVLVK